MEYVNVYTTYSIFDDILYIYARGQFRAYVLSW